LRQEERKHVRKTWYAPALKLVVVATLAATGFLIAAALNDSTAPHTQEIALVTPKMWFII
jgi:hypothetical protein